MFEAGEPYKYLDFPLSNYASASYDSVMHHGKTVGFSMFTGYSYNERTMLSLGVVDPDVEIGSEVTVVWGEAGGGTRRTHGRAPQADRDSRDREPRALLEGGARKLRCGLAYSSGLNESRFSRFYRCNPVEGPTESAEEIEVQASDAEVLAFKGLSDVVNDRLGPAVHKRFGEGRILAEHVHRIADTTSHSISKQRDKVCGACQPDPDRNFDAFLAQAP